MTKSDSRGYTVRLLREVEALDPTAVPTRFAKMCIERDIPVSDVAQKFGVTRASVYAWFTGTHQPRASIKQMMSDILEKLDGNTA